MDAKLSEIEKRHYRRYNFHGQMYGESCETCVFIKETKRLEAKNKELRKTQIPRIWEQRTPYQQTRWFICNRCRVEFWSEAPARYCRRCG